ncbi:ABC transporter permease [Clostridium sp. UBA1056]|uniref:ABC transporter permease n=1 Tax=unclassified Clostridium TaxID=2614128 RepID=UPI0032162D33
MNSLNKIAKNNVLFNKGRSIITCISIIISIALMVSVDILITSSKKAAEVYSTNIDKTPLILYTLSLIVGIVVIIFIYSTFKLSVAENTKLYGTLIAIGLKRNRLFKLVILQGLIYSIISIPTGLGIGFLMSKIFLALSNNFLIYSSLSFPVILTSHSVILAIAYGLTSILISLFRPAIIASSVAPINAINNPNSFELLSSNSCVPKVLCKFLNYKWRLALTDIFSNKSKSFFIVLVLSISLILVTITSSILGYTDEFGEKSKINTFDFEVISKYNFSEEYISYLSENSLIDSVNTLENLSMFYNVSESIINKKHPSYEYIPFKDGVGTILSNLISFDYELLNDSKNYIESGVIDTENLDDGVIVYINDSRIDTINNSIAHEKLVNLKVGDKVFLESFPPEHNTYIGQVKAIVNSLPYVPSAHIEDDVYFVVSDKTYDKILNKSGTKCLGIKLKDKANEEDLENFLQMELDKSNISEFNNNIDYKRKLKRDAEFIKYFFLFFSFMLFSVGIIITINMMVGNIITKSKQFSIYKAIGMKKKQINNIILNELIVYMSSSLFIGISFGIPLSKFAYDKYVKVDLIKLYTYPYFEVGLYIILMIISMLIAYFISIRQVHKSMNIREGF